jgi:hypothetical protein
MVKASACHDEVNVYRFSKVPGRAEAFLVTASKAVEGSGIVMSSGEWTYDAENRVAKCKSPAIRI